MIDESTSKATVVMSIESTRVKPGENPYRDEAQRCPSAADRSTQPSGSGDTVRMDADRGGETQPVGSANGFGEDGVGKDGAESPSLPVDPKGDLPNWMLLNIAIPTLILIAAAGLVKYLGTVESPARPPLDDTPVGRLFALPAVDVVPVRSLASTGEKLHLSADGTVVPYREASLATEVDGRIVEKSPLCEAGKYVTKGHVLMKIDPTDYELTVKRLQREQQQAYESLGEVDQEIINTGRSLELGRADRELQQREVNRREALPEQYASQGEIDQARRAVLTAEQQVVLYQNQLDLAKKKRTRLESSERLAALQLEAAEIDLKRTEIVAPIDGVIVSEQAELNTFVSRGSSVVTIEDTSKVEVAAKLRVDQLYWVLNQKGASDSPENDGASNDGASESIDQDRGYRLPPTPVNVRYVVSGRDGLVYQWKGKLSGYDGIGLDEQTRTVPVRIVVDDPRGFEVIRGGKVVNSGDKAANVAGPTTLVRGMFVSLRLELDPAVDLVILPSEALKPGNRVWQFVADPSVLEESLLPADGASEAKKSTPAAAELAATEPATDDAASDSAENQKDAGAAATVPDEMDPLASFDPEAWVAGELKVLHGIRPVDQFVTTAQFDAGRNFVGGDEEDPDVGIAWICEISDTALQDGSFVVVSPMGSIRTDAFPVRAPADDLTPEQNSRTTGGGEISAGGAMGNLTAPAKTAAELTKALGRRPTEPLPVASATGKGLDKTASPEGDTGGYLCRPPAFGGFVVQPVRWLTPPAIRVSASGLASWQRLGASE